MTEFVVRLANRPGMLASLTEALSSAGVQIESLTAHGFDADGVVRLIVDDAVAASDALKSAGLKSEEHPVLTTRLDHSPTALAAMTRDLADAGVNIEALYVLHTGNGDLEVAIAVDDPERAGGHLTSSRPS